MPHKKKAKTNSVAIRRMKELRRLSKHFVYWRYHEDNDKSEVVTNRLLLDRNLSGVPIIDIEMEMQAQALNYQCVTISYYQTPFGDKYRYFGFAQTTTPLQLTKTDVTPLITIAKEMAENNRNNKQLYARAMILMPNIRNSVDVMSVIRHIKKQLDITDLEISQLGDMLVADAEKREFDDTPNLDTDEKIRWFLEQQN